MLRVLLTATEVPTGQQRDAGELFDNSLQHLRALEGSLRSQYVFWDSCSTDALDQRWQFGQRVDLIVRQPVTDRVVERLLGTLSGPRGRVSTGIHSPSIHCTRTTR